MFFQRFFQTFHNFAEYDLNIREIIIDAKKSKILLKFSKYEILEKCLKCIVTSNMNCGPNGHHLSLVTGEVPLARTRV